MAGLFDICLGRDMPSVFLQVVRHSPVEFVASDSRSYWQLPEPRATGRVEGIEFPVLLRTFRRANDILQKRQSNNKEATFS